MSGAEMIAFGCAFSIGVVGLAMGVALVWVSVVPVGRDESDGFFDASSEKKKGGGS